MLENQFNACIFVSSMSGWLLFLLFRFKKVPQFLSSRGTVIKK